VLGVGKKQMRKQNKIVGIYVLPPGSYIPMKAQELV
jgi:hypothetical protein